MDWLMALVALTAMEIVLGIDNIVFISILCAKLPEEKRALARTLGLAMAMITRLLLLFSLTWVLSWTNPLFHLTDLGIPEGWLRAEWMSGGFEGHGGHEPAREVSEAVREHRFEELNSISVRDLILLFGGLFLIGNSVLEIHHKLEGEHDKHKEPRNATFGSVLFQIAVLDIIFSLDSVITAVGMARQIWVMVTAVIIAIVVMMIFAGAVERFVNRHPTVKMLALSFLILIGVLLVAEGIGTPVNKGYIYFAMAFSLIVELMNMRIRKTQTPPGPVLSEPAAG